MLGIKTKGKAERKEVRKKKGEQQRGMTEGGRAERKETRAGIKEKKIEQSSVLLSRLKGQDSCCLQHVFRGPAGVLCQTAVVGCLRYSRGGRRWRVMCVLGGRGYRERKMWRV